MCEVNNFWSTYTANEKLIKRCFFHIYKRLPDPEGSANSYNNLVVRFNEMNVFERFNLRKLAEAANLTDLSNKDDLSKEDLMAAGINVQKKWEQFIYSWVYKFLSDEYAINGKLIKNFCHNEDMIEYGIPKEELYYWLDGEEEKEYSEKVASYKDKDRRGRIYPPTFNDRHITKDDEYDDACDALALRDIKDNICKRLRGNYDKQVFELVMQGYPNSVIAEKLDISHVYVIGIIKKIQSTALKCVTL